MLQLHLSDRKFNCLLRCILYKRLDGTSSDIILHTVRPHRALGRHFFVECPGPHHLNFQGPQANFEGFLHWNTLPILHWALRQNFTRAPLDLQGARALTSGPPRVLPHLSRPSSPSDAKNPLGLWQMWFRIWHAAHVQHQTELLFSNYQNSSQPHHRHPLNTSFYGHIYLLSKGVNLHLVKRYSTTFSYIILG